MKKKTRHNYLLTKTKKLKRYSKIVRIYEFLLKYDFRLRRFYNVNNKFVKKRYRV